MQCKEERWETTFVSFMKPKVDNVLNLNTTVTSITYVTYTSNPNHDLFPNLTSSFDAFT